MNNNKEVFESLFREVNVEHVEDDVSSDETWGGYSKDSWNSPSSILVYKNEPGDVFLLEQTGIHIDYALNEEGVVLDELFSALAPGFFVCECVTICDKFDTACGYEYDSYLSYDFRPLTDEEFDLMRHGKSILDRGSAAVSEA